jgi:TolB-like protein
MRKIYIKSVNSRACHSINLLPTIILLFAVLLMIGCSSSLPSSYYDYEYERDYKVGVISDRLVEQVPADIKLPVVLVVTSFVQLDDFSKTSRFGLLMAEQLLSRLAGQGFILRETRMKDIFYQSPNGEFVLSREFSKVAQELDARLVLLGTYLEARDHVLVNTRLVDFSKQSVVASYDCQLAKTPDISELLSD